MIRMEQPSFCFNSYDIGFPFYTMWQTFKGPEGITLTELVSKIFAANLLAMSTQESSMSEHYREYRLPGTRIQGSPLLNIILNTHGFSGGLRIGGLNHTATLKDDLGPFAVLKPHNIGPIWITSCEIAKDTTGKTFCSTLAALAGTQVIASEDSQQVTWWQGLQEVMAARFNIDDFSGTVYCFNADGSRRVVTDPTSDPQIMTVRGLRW